MANKIIPASTPALGGTAAEGSPPLPPSPLLPVPAPMVASKPKLQARAPLKAFDGPTQQQKAARSSAVAARTASKNLLSGLNSQLAQIRTQLAVHDSNPDGLAEWAREQVSVDDVRSLAEAAESLLNKFMPPVTPPAPPAPAPAV